MSIEERIQELQEELLYLQIQKEKMQALDDEPEDFMYTQLDFFDKYQGFGGDEY